jgi:hypothetical protein
MAVYDGGEGEEDAAATEAMAYQRGSVDCEVSVDIPSSIGLSPEVGWVNHLGHGDVWDRKLQGDAKCDEADAQLILTSKCDAKRDAKRQSVVRVMLN